MSRVFHRSHHCFKTALMKASAVHALFGGLYSATCGQVVEHFVPMRMPRFHFLSYLLIHLHLFYHVMFFTVIKSGVCTRTNGSRCARGVDRRGSPASLIGSSPAAEALVRSVLRSCIQDSAETSLVQCFVLADTPVKTPH